MKIYWKHYSLTCMICLQAAGALQAQERSPVLELGLESAIDIAVKNSYDQKAAINQYKSSFWNYRNYKAAFFPKLFLNGTLPDYTRAIGRITLPNGELSFVEQNQAYSSLDLGVSQNIGFTGGRVSLFSSLNRIDVFG